MIPPRVSTYHLAPLHVTPQSCDSAEDANLLSIAFIEENKRLLPVALFVNKESRDHALGCHTIIHRDEIAAPIKYAGLRPLCAKASDVFWVEFITMMNCPDELHDWISAIKTNHAGFIDSITKLAVRGTFSEFFFPRVLNDNKNTCQSSAEIDPSRKMICGSLLLFPALKEITFTGKNGDKDWVTPLGSIQLEQLKAWIIAFLEQLKPLFNDGTASHPSHLEYDHWLKLIISGPNRKLPSFQDLPTAYRCITSKTS